MTNLPNAVQFLFSPSDLILLAIIVANVIMGANRGFIRTIFGLFGKLAAIAGATVGAKLMTPFVAEHLVTPIIGEALQKQVTVVLQAANVDGGTAFLSQISQTLVQILDFDNVKTATQPLQEAIAQATQGLAESITYFIVFAVLVVLLSMVIRIAGETVHFLTDATPLKAVDRLGGALFGAVCGAVLCVVLLWVLHQFAPAIFTELGALSPSQVEKTLLTQKILQLFQS